MRRRAFIFAAALAAAVAAATAASVATAASAAGEYDPASGLFIAPGYQAVAVNCLACHSARIIIQQGLSRDKWEDTIEWMQEEQGLWPIPAPTLGEILDYLAAHYGPSRPHFSPAK